MLLVCSSSLLGASDKPYILPGRLLRVSQKPKSHLEILNESALDGFTSGNEAGHWAGWVKRSANSVVCFSSWLLRMITEGLTAHDCAC